MKRLLCGILSVIMWIAVSGQQDSVYVNARISAHSNQIGVHQEIVWHNTTGTPLNKIKLLNWTAAYKNRNTPLLKRKLEDRKRLDIAKSILMERDKMTEKEAYTYIRSLSMDKRCDMGKIIDIIILSGETNA